MVNMTHYMNLWDDSFQAIKEEGSQLVTNCHQLKTKTTGVFRGKSNGRN